MPQAKKPPKADVQEVLLNATHVQLATLRAGIDFWRGWVEQTSTFVEAASDKLAGAAANPDELGQTLLQLTDASLESLRAMTDLPRRAAESYLAELERLTKATASKTGSRSRPKPRRSARAKD